MTVYPCPPGSPLFAIGVIRPGERVTPFPEQSTDAPQPEPGEAPFMRPRGAEMPA